MSCSTNTPHLSNNTGHSTIETSNGSSGISTCAVERPTPHSFLELPTLTITVVVFWEVSHTSHTCTQQGRRPSQRARCYSFYFNHLLNVRDVILSALARQSFAFLDASFQRPHQLPQSLEAAIGQALDCSEENRSSSSLFRGFQRLSPRNIRHSRVPPFFRTQPFPYG